MVGFFHGPAIEGAIKEGKQDLKTQPLSDSRNPSTPNDPLDLCHQDPEEFSSHFSDSFLDFDSINAWLMEGNPELCVDPSMASLVETGPSKDSFEGIGEGILKKDGVEEGFGEKEGPLVGLVQEKKTRVVESVSEKIKLEEVLIEEQLGKVSLCGNLGSGLSLGGVDVSKSGEVNGAVSDEDESDSDVKSEGKNSSSSSSSSSSSGEENEEDEDSVEKKGKNEERCVEEEVDIEEGEIRLSDEEDEMVAWSDSEFAEEDGGVLGPITSKNEIKVLPPVPAVTVTLQPHHETLPVGLILSILGAQVIVEGVEKHNPLNEGSILWITESRSPLGIVDEIFGPVKNPYYIVRYNSESEVPAGIEQGTLVTFVEDFANHVLNDKSLYQKGYDASGEHDEELSDDLEFSDDEKEAEYRRMQKMKKRGKNESKPGKKRNEKRQLKNQKGNWNLNRDPPPQTPLSGDNIPPVTHQDQHFAPPISAPSNQENYTVNQALVPPFAHMAQAPGFYPPNGNWNSGFPNQPQQNIGLPNGLPPNGMLWMQQNRPFPLFQTPNMAFQQQIGMIPGLPLNFNALGGQPNFGGAPPNVPWLTSMDQNTLNSSFQFGMGVQGGPHGSLLLNGAGEQGGGQSQGPQNSHNNSQQSPASLNFNQGRGGGGRRGGHQRGRGGRFGGGRGRYQNR